MEKVIEKNKRRINKIRQLMSKIHLPYRSKNKQAIIDEIRKTREKLWEEKLATNS